MSLTDHLASLSTPTPYAAAVSHPFLTSAAALTLPSSRLAFYLSQNRIYTPQACPPGRFTAQLIAKIPLDDTSPNSLATRTLAHLAGSLSNVVHDLALFDTIASTYNLPLGHGYWRERKPTRDYTAEIARIGTSASLEDGLVFLWAMEKVYLDAWSTVYSALPQPSASQGDTDLTIKAIRDLSFNWSNANPDFVKSVQEIGDLVDAYFAPVMAGQSLAGRSAPEALASAEEIWARVVAEFWPNEGEEDMFCMKKD